MGSATTSEQQRRSRRARSLRAPAATPGFSQIATDNLGDLLVEQGDYVQARPRLEEAHELFRQLGDERMVGVVVVNLGTLAAREGRSDEAEALLRQGLEYAEAQVDKELAIWCLGELAALTLSKGDAERAARLMGAVERLREETGHALQPDQRALGRADKKRSRVRARRATPCRRPHDRSRDDVRAGRGLRVTDLGAQPYLVIGRCP